MKTESQDQAIKTLTEENEALRKKTGTLDEAMQLVKDSSMELEKMKAEKDQLEGRVKEPFVQSLVKDSKGCFAEADLARLPISSLLELRETFDGEVRAIFDDWMASRQKKDAERNQRSLGTVGSFNQETKSYEKGYEGGVR